MSHVRALYLVMPADAAVIRLSTVRVIGTSAA